MLHLLGLDVELGQHLLLQGLNLHGVLDMVVIDRGLKLPLTGGQLLNLHLQSLHPLFLTVYLHGLRSGLDFGKQGLFQPLFHLMQDISGRRC